MLLGCFINPEEARSESVFSTERAGSLASLVIQSPSLEARSPGADATAVSYSVFPADSTQLVDIEVPEAKPHHRYKEIIGFAIVGAVVAYAAITIFKPDEESNPSPGGSGKPTPSRGFPMGFSVRFSR